MIEITPGNRDVVRAAALPGRADVYFAKPEDLKQRPGWNDARKMDPDYPAHVRRLADIMKASGFHRDKPLSVAPDADGSLYITDGHSRHDAVMLANAEGAGIEAIPFMVEQKGTTEEDRLFDSFDKNTHKPLTPLGEAVNIKRLMSRGVSLETIAERLAYSPAIIAARLDLIASPQPVKDMVQAGRVSASLAVAVVREHKAEAVAVLQAAGESALKFGEGRIKPAAVARVVKSKDGPSDKAMLDWLIKSRPAHFVVLSKPGLGRFYALMVEDGDGVERRLGEGITGRDAIADAMSKEGK